MLKLSINPQPKNTMFDEDYEENFLESYFHGLDEYEPEPEVQELPDFEDLDERDYEDSLDDPTWLDGDALASAGFGTDEDYGYFGGDEW